MKVSIPKCQHPKCSALLQRIYKWVAGRFVPVGRLCECGQVMLDIK